MAESEYWKNFDSLYGEYRWFQKTLTSNIFIRMWHETIHLLFQAMQFTVILSLIFSFYSFWDYFLQKRLPTGSVPLALLILALSLSLYGFFMVLGADINGLRNQRDSNLRKIIKRFAPRLLNFWDKEVLSSKRKIKVPKMYSNQNQP